MAFGFDVDLEDGGALRAAEIAKDALDDRVQLFYYRLAYGGRLTDAELAEMDELIKVGGRAKAGDEDLREFVMNYVRGRGDCDLNWIDVSNVTNMRYLFYGCWYFGGDVSKWNVSSVTNMHGMFQGCQNFDRDISGWDVRSVTDMGFMFHGCDKFDRDISKWKVRAVTIRGKMFDGCPISDGRKPKFKG